MKDTVVAGSLRATDTLFSTTAQFQILRVPTSSNGTTFGPGSANNLLKSNGTSVYWTTLVASDIPTISITDKTSGTLPVTRGGTGVTAIANIQAGKDGDGNTISSTYLKLSGGTLTGDLGIVFGDTDKFLNFWYNTNKTAGASWRLGVLGSGSSDTNYFIIQSGTSTPSATTWNNVIRIGQNTYDVAFGGNIYPLENNTKTLGTSSNKWSNVYSTTFTGNLTGNAATATKFASSQNITLTGDTTGTVSSQAGWSITTKTDRLSTVGDNRAVATIPNDYSNKIIFQGLKTNSDFNSPSADSYSYVIGLRGWSESSGGKAHEFAFNDSGINHRIGSTTSWESWEKIITSGNYTDYTVTKTGSGASGTWNINVTGNAANVTGTVSVDHGGTGATTADGARTNLGITPANIGALPVDGSIGMNTWVTIDNDGAGIDIAMSGGKHWYLYPINNGSTFSIAGNDGTDWFWALKVDMATKKVSLNQPLDITSGGTGATTKYGAVENLFFENQELDAQYLASLKSGWIGGNIPLPLNPRFGGTGATTAAGARANLGAVAKTGDTMTGDLTVQHSSEVNIHAVCTNTNVDVALESSPTGRHGIWSFGYWNGSSLVNDGKWMIYRNTNGKIIFNDTLGVDHGGTGKTNANDAANALITSLPTWSATPTDSTYLIRRDTAGTATYGQVTFSTVYDYIKTKASGTWGINITGDANYASNLYQSSGNWWDAKSFGYYHYEGGDINTNKLPINWVEILRWGSTTRGAALAVDWRNGQGQVYVNSMHDDSEQSSFSGWQQLLRLVDISSNVKRIKFNASPSSFSASLAIVVTDTSNVEKTIYFTPTGMRYVVGNDTQWTK